MTIPEYLALVKAQQEKELNREYEMNRIAWLSMVAQSKDKKGRLIYKTFEKLFDRKKLMERLKRGGQGPAMSESARRVLEFRKKRKGVSKHVE